MSNGLSAVASSRKARHRNWYLLAAAIRWAEAAKLTPADTPHPLYELVYFAYVRLLLIQNRAEDARILLATMKRSAQEGRRHRKLITIYLQQALVQQALDYQEQALARVESALRLAVPEAYRRAFLDEGPGIVDLLLQIRHIAPDFVDQVLNAASVEPVIPRVQALVEPLSERELEVLWLLTTRTWSHKEAPFMADGREFDQQGVHQIRVKGNLDEEVVRLV